MKHPEPEDSPESARLFRANCRSRSVKMSVDVLDLTTAGCMVTSYGLAFSPNDQVSIQLPGLRYLPAFVVWTNENVAGLQFEEPLYEPVLAHLFATIAS